MSIVKTHLIHQEYRDSVQLLRAASAADKLEGVLLTSVLMGTQNNKPLLEDVGLLTQEAIEAGANDIVIVVQADSEKSCDDAIQFIVDYFLYLIDTVCKDNAPVTFLEKELLWLDDRFVKHP